MPSGQGVYSGAKEEKIMKKTLILAVMAAFLTTGCVAFEAAHMAWMSAHIAGKVLNARQKVLAPKDSMPSSGAAQEANAEKSAED